MGRVSLGSWFSSLKVRRASQRGRSNLRICEKGRMAAAVELPKEYGYVVLTLVAYVLLNFWMARQVGNARRKYKVFYPTMYASESENKDAKVFNCVQRGHQNALEMAPIFFVLLLLGGLKHPLVSTGFGIAYWITRYFYFTGYSTGDPKNRLKIGGMSFPALFGLLLCTISFGVSLVRG